MLVINREEYKKARRPNHPRTQVTTCDKGVTVSKVVYCTYMVISKVVYYTCSFVSKVVICSCRVVERNTCPRFGL